MDNKQTFILQEVIDELVNAEKSIVGPLLKLNYFGLLTKNTQLIEYTNRELNGYSKDDNDNIPDYRNVPISIQIDMQAGYETHKNLQLPAEMLAPPFNEGLKKMPIYEGISILEKMEIAGKQEEMDYIYKPFQLVMLHYFQKPATSLYKFGISADVIAARAKFSQFKILEILQIVRSKLLVFTMEVGEEFGYNIEINSFKKKQDQNNQQIVNYMNTSITNTGDGNVVNTGDHSSQQVTINISKGDTEKLMQAMSELGIDDNDVEELKKIVVSEQPDYEKKTLGSQAISWITKITGKALSGVGKIAIKVSSSVLAEYIKQYYGLSS
jgi:AbiTii